MYIMDYLLQKTTKKWLLNLTLQLDYTSLTRNQKEIV